jgi:aminoglycoside phosphotransferase (APT) family kinase protein
MSFSRYLAVINTALLEIVLPDLQSTRAKEFTEGCVRALAAIAANLEAPSSEQLNSLDTASLPAELARVARFAAPDRTLHLPAGTPVEDWAISNGTLPITDAGSKWLAAHDWDHDAEQRMAAAALIGWEHSLRVAALSRVDALEKGLVESPAGVDKTPDVHTAALETYLRARLQAPSLTIKKFKFLPGGRSRQTALFSISGYDGLPEQMVVQRDHPTYFTYSVTSQFPLLARLHAAGLKVPLPYLLEAERHWLGAPFMVVERLPGEPPVSGMNYFQAPPASPTLAKDLARELARLHRLPVDDVASFLPRTIAAGEDWASDITKWEESWNRMAHLPSMVFAAAIAWMRQHVGCVEAIDVIVHTDPLFHNILAENELITGLLDWEATAIGHPGEDIGYVKPVIEQMMEWDEFMAAYYANGGPLMTTEQIDYFTIRSLVRLIVYIMITRETFETGKTDDPSRPEVGASFLPKLFHRLGAQLCAIIQKS